MCWKVRSSWRAYDYPPYLSVDRQKVTLPNGKEIDDYHRLIMPATTMVMGITKRSKVVTLFGYRHGVGENTRMFPGGIIEPGEAPLAGAKRELLEETGYSGGEWTPLGNFVPLSNYGAGKVYLFKAVGLEKTHDVNNNDLEDTAVEVIDRSSVLEEMKSGEFKSLGSLAIIALGFYDAF